MSRPKLRPESYTVGWVCALPIELAAAHQILDEEHHPLSIQDPNETNPYTLGRIDKYNVVIASLPAGHIGTTSATFVAARMQLRFPSIRVGLLVGIGGGVPNSKTDIRLGDVVISRPEKQYGGVVQYDLGKTWPCRFERTGSLNSPPDILLNALSKLQSHNTGGISNVANHLSKFRHLPEFSRENAGPDILFEPNYQHHGGDTCETCDTERQIRRDCRGNREIAIHCGTIASGNSVMRDGQSRDRISQELGGVLCFEMEAAGLMNSFPCLVIRGICDYADSHKNKAWQPYASAAAAVCAKEILLIAAANQAAETRRALGVTFSERLQSLIERVNLDSFLQMLSVKDEEQPEFKDPIDCNDPGFYWIFKNIDFKAWERSSHSRKLFLSGPSDSTLRKVSSHVVQQGTASLTQSGCVLYFFCPPLVKETTTAKLVHSFLHQTISWSRTQTKLSIVKVFLHALREKLVERFSEQSENVVEKRPQLSPKLQAMFNGPTKSEDHLQTIKTMLEEASNNEQWAASKAALGMEQEPKMLVVIHGLSDMERHKNDFTKEVLEFAEFLKTRKSTVKILLTSRPQADLKEAFATVPCIEYDKERKECLTSLRFDNSRYDKIAEEHQGSLEWIWTHDQYQKWLDVSASRLLYLQGKPGSGKSTLTKYFTKCLLQREPNVQSAIVAKFFYSYREGEAQRSHYNMLRSVLYHILDQDETFFYHCFQHEYRCQPQLYNDGSEIAKWKYGSLKKLLLSLRDHTVTKRVYLIIDAVDESDDDERREILDLLLKICSETKECVVKTFVASRPVAALERRISEFHSFIRLQDETQSDIFHFADFFLQQVEFPNFREQARTYMVENANGVFLWVKLVGQELLAYDEQGWAQEDVFDFLKSLPTELDKFYQLMLEKMSGRTQKENSDGIKMFRFVLFACRPLAVWELLHALGIPDDRETTFNVSDELFHRRVPQERRIAHCSGNFLEVKQRDGKATVQAMHQTVREFFLRPHGYVEVSKFRMVRSCALQTWKQDLPMYKLGPHYNYTVVSSTSTKGLWQPMLYPILDIISIAAMRMHMSGVLALSLLMN
ncbi:purine and uridine phosphorylase [Fusarium albosuccineum]|uniref:Purine and uridine phosphorylase n=1 Tax=Fusarium albosuccineum TaxID=1237068 RepID=A0A8H4KVJ5_9HYPO|nr:purine and uridine phosphorylase [Fusarium albosuccineum]